LTSSSVPQSSKLSQLDADYKGRLTITSQGKHDELKEWLTRRWESSDGETATSSVPSVTTTAGVKRKASAMLETPADSTEDVFASSSRSTAGGRKSLASKVSKNNILLASLLATRASAEQPVVNTLSIGSIATVTPQINLLKRAPAGQSLIGDLVASSDTVRKSSSSSLSSVTSVSAAGDTGTSLSSSTTQNPSQVYRSYSQGGSRGPNPMLAEASLPYQDAGSLDVKNDVASQDLAPADIMESLCDAPGTSNALSLMDDTTLMNQLEQFFSSPSGMTELESLFGDDLTSALFGNEQADVCSQPALSGIDSQPIKSEPQSDGQSQQFTTGRTRGPGLLGQLLGPRGDHGSVAESCSTIAAASEVFPQRPSSLAVSSTYLHRGVYSRTCLCRHCHNLRVFISW